MNVVCKNLMIVTFDVISYISDSTLKRNNSKKKVKRYKWQALAVIYFLISFLMYLYLFH